MTLAMVVLLVVAATTIYLELRNAELRRMIREHQPDQEPTP